MFSICKQIHSATAVEFCVSCRFFNNSEENLVVAGVNVLKVYRISPSIDAAQRQKQNLNDMRVAPKMRLECLATYTLYGNVMSLQCVSLAGAMRDALLISFKDAKLSVLQHDPDTFALKTLSLHYFEEEDIRGGWTGRYHVPVVRVDPDARCAVMLVYGKRLVVLPFRKDNSLDEIELDDVKPIKKAPTALVTRTPIMASYLIALRDLDEKIDNVLDIQFLHGYYEPTLLILYEPVRTFAGRIKVRSDTCVLVAISLNIQQRVHPIIWTVNSLPFDSLFVLPIQKPIGGCLVLTVNAVIYLNQSVPPYGVSLNSSAENSTSFPLKPQDGVRISLDCANFAFIDVDKLVVSLRTGDLYVMTICVDSMRMTEYIFLGSRLGNSLLLHFAEEDQSTVITLDDAEVEDCNVQNFCETDLLDVTPQTKARRIEDEELEVYGLGAKTSVLQLRKFVFEVCDSLLNVAPINFMCAGERVEFEDDGTTLRPQAETLNDLKIELVGATGHGKNGALCVLVNTIHPQIITSFELEGCFDVWTVFDDSTKKTARQDHHDFLLLSQGSSTLILQTGNEINEIENTGFTVNQPTIFVGNIGQSRFIVQVTSRQVRLLQGTRLLQNVPVDVGSPVVQVSIADPYVCLRIRNGQVITLALRETRSLPRLAINKHTISSTPAVVTLSAYKDLSGLFTSKSDDVLNLSNNVGGCFGNNFGGCMKTEPNMKVEDEEDLLYGDAGNAFKINSMADLAKQSKQKNSDWWRRLLLHAKPTYWLIVTRINGTLEIYSMPDMKLVYLVNDIGNGATVLTDAMEFVPVTLTHENSKQGILHACMPQHASSPVPLEISMVGLGSHGQRPLLLVLTQLELLIYQVFRYPNGHLKLRFRKLEQLNLIDQSSHIEIDDNEDIESYNMQLKYVQKLRYFSNVGGIAGIMLCGIHPCFIFLTGRGELRIHKFQGNGGVRSFAAFNNVNIPNGFLYFDNSYELKIAVLPTYLSYDSTWPLRKVPIRCTPRQIVYHRENRVYCLVTQTDELMTKYYRFNGEDKELSEESRGERFIYPVGSKFEMVLISPETWEIVPDASIKFEPWEHVTAFKIVKLSYEGTRSGLKEYLCIGTNFNYSEDITSRGNIHIYDIIEVVPEPGKPMTKYKLKEVFKKEQKGPVSAISDVLGFLVTGLGQKIYIWQLRDGGDLNGVAFCDTNIYVHNIITVKSLIFIADVYKSVSLLRFQEEYRTLSLASRDFNPLEVFGIEFLVDNTNLGFLVTDAERNLIVYMYQPEARESLGGQKLLRKADYHLGQVVNTMFRVQCHQRGVHQRQPFLYEHKHFVVYGTLDGALGFCLPLPEKVYRRFLMLQNVLLSYQDHLCGLNPKEYRTLKSLKKLSMNPSRCIIDGDLIWSYRLLAHSERNEIAKKIGTRTEDILSDLLEIERLSSMF
ncbi:cleavage and polyadenylation specificity factor subunit 1 isoform X2 [Scaptodrosophila lebanonensis]|uniref:Cleavage and polyadenylation specificity factor subunit 1 n=1 Tax=Drosophila lebanonensis TaxID=7225 RepID=A0A6J2TTT3_DROLE|nr:cleavage and polyadenylation specificity factor subunit 1 isoform X2 [Scaptodrosophila lebanonensis]